MPTETSRPSGRRRRRRPTKVDADKILSVPVSSLTLSDRLAREPVNDDRLADLAASITRHGVLHPLLVRVRDDGYEVISGSRRLAAIRLAGLTEVPIVVSEVAERDIKPEAPASRPPTPRPPASRPPASRPSAPRAAEPEAEAPRSSQSRQPSRRNARPQTAQGRQPVRMVQRRRPQTLSFGRGQLLVDYEAGTIDLRRAKLDDLRALLNAAGGVTTLEELARRLERLSPHL